MSTDIDLDEMEAVARDLDGAGRSLDETGSSAPCQVDAGSYSSLVMSVISRLVDGAAGLAEGMVDLGAGVEQSVAAYRRADVSTVEDFRHLDPGTR